MLACICRVNCSNSFQFVQLFEVTSVNQPAGTVQFPAHLEPVNWPQKLRLPICVSAGNFKNMNTKTQISTGLRESKYEEDGENYIMKDPIRKTKLQMEDNIKNIIQDIGWRRGRDCSVSGQGQVARSCECGNEPSGTIKCGEFLDQQRELLASQEGLCFVALVRVGWVGRLVRNEEVNNEYRMFIRNPERKTKV